MTTTIKPRTFVITTVGVNKQTGASSMERLLGTVGPQLTVAGTPRKRQRLSHLNQDERLMRRKLKNRVAAQLARDRKRDKMTDLEQAFHDMEEQNERLQQENEELRRRTSILSTENNSLRSTLGLGEERSDVKVESVQVPTESAEFSSCSQQKYRAPRLTPSMASATCLSLILTLSLSSLLGSKILSLRQSSLCRRAHSRGKVQKPRPAQPRASKWWGPQQQSWNPSENL